MSIIQGNTKVSAGGYQIDQSARFNDGDSPELSRTYSISSPWTFSAWVKRCELGSENLILGASGGEIHFNSDDTLEAEGTSSSAVFRDPAGWYHIHVSDNGLYVNGVSHGSVTTTNLSNQKLFDDFDGYVAEVHLQSGTSAYTNFGETNDDGVWIPKSASSGDTYLTFADSSDFGSNSGSGGDWTASGLTSDDQRGDTPTVNQSVFNLLDQNGTSNIGTFSDGNLTLATSSNDSLAATSIPVIESGCYWEAKIDSAGDEMFGLWVSSTKPLRSASTSSPHTDAASCVIRVATNTVYNEGSGSSFSPATISTNDVVMFAYKNGQFFYGKNGAWENSGDPVAETGELFTITSSSSKVIVPVFGRSGGSNVTYTLHMSEEDFTYTAPTGYVALSTANLPTPAITDGSAYFQTTLYTGNGTAIGSGGNAVTQIGNSTFQPDFVWMKSRSAATDHALYDAVRGTTKEVISNSVAIESTLTEGLTTFGAAGFTVGSDAAVNTNTATYAAWQWLAANGTASNTDGSITSTVSANTTAGFSVVTYTGTGSAATVGHGLGAEPQFIAIKSRTYVESWGVYPGTSMGYGGQYRLKLNETSPVAASSGFWNNTDATSSVFSLGTELKVNKSGEEHVAYCWAEVEGFSKFGSYVSNGSTDGPFVSCGFRPAFLLIKDTQNAEYWHIYDSTRDTYNVTEKYLYANLADAEATSSTKVLDFLSNGFKLRGTDGGINSSSGRTYIFMAFAEHPFGGDGVAPVPAR